MIIRSPLVVALLIVTWLVLSVLAAMLYHLIVREQGDPLERAFNAPSAKSKYDHPRTREEN
jgi:hypothetical protein